MGIITSVLLSRTPNNPIETITLTKVLIDTAILKITITMGQLVESTSTGTKLYQVMAYKHLLINNCPQPQTL